MASITDVPSLTKSVTVLSAGALLDRAGAGGYRVAAKQLRDTLRARRPEGVVLHLADDPAKRKEMRVIARIAAALDVAVARGPEVPELALQNMVCNAASPDTAVHLVSDSPLAALWLDRANVIWHSPTGAVRRAEAERLQQEHPLLKDRWADFVFLTSNPWVGTGQATKWLEQYGSLVGVLEAHQELEGAAGRRFRLLMDDLVQQQKALATEISVQPKDIVWRRPKGARKRALISKTYRRLGLSGWLTNTGSDEPIIIEPAALDALLCRLNDQEEVAIDAVIGDDGVPRRVLLEGDALGQTYEVDVEKSALGDVLERRLVSWLGNHPPQVPIYTRDLGALAPWLADRGLKQPSVAMDLALGSRALESQGLEGLPIESLGGSLREQAADLRTRILEWDPATLDWLSDVETPLVGVLANMKSAGIAVDGDRLAELCDRVNAAAEAGDQDAVMLRTHYMGRILSALAGDRLHPHYDQFSGRNWRIGTSQPQLQNLPNSSWGLLLKACLVPAGEDRSFISLDYKQIEMVLLANLSGDRAMMSAFEEGLDIHRQTAAELFKKPEHQVTDQERRAAKAINFGLIYGKTPYGLAKTLGTTEETAKAYIDRYFQAMTGAKDYLDGLARSATQNAFVETLHGRRIHVPGADSTNRRERSRALRQAANAPMQGSAAELFKRAMLAASDWIQADGSDTRIVLQVHDELIVETNTSDVGRVGAAIQELMVAVAPNIVGLGLDLATGRSLAQLKETPDSPEMTGRPERSAPELH